VQREKQECQLRRKNVGSNLRREQLNRKTVRKWNCSKGGKCRKRASSNTGRKEDQSQIHFHFKPYIEMNLIKSPTKLFIHCWTCVPIFFGIFALLTEDQFLDDSVELFLKTGRFVRAVNNKTVVLDVKLGLGSQFISKIFSRVYKYKIRDKYWLYLQTTSFFLNVY